MQEHPAVVLVGVDCLQGLQCARLLRRRGIRVVGVAQNRDHYVCRTRACDEILVGDTGSERLVEKLLVVGPTFTTPPVLIACQDKNVLVVSRHRVELEPWYRMVLPPADAVELLIDKAGFYRYARERGLPLPATVELRTPDDAARATEVLQFPAIVKPSVRLREWSKHTKEKAVIVEDPERLLEQYKRLSSWAPVLLAQELIQGPDSNHFTCNSVFGRNGELLAEFTSQKLRQWAPGTGQACLSQAVPSDAVARVAEKLFRDLGCQGLTYLEMKKDDRTGEYLIIEPNIARPTGRAAAAEASGVELLYTHYCDAAGLEPPPPRRQGLESVKWIHLTRDLQASAYHLRRRELTLREWWSSIRGPKVYAIWSVRDPMPFVAALASAIGQALGLGGRWQLPRVRWPLSRPGRDGVSATVALVGADGSGKSTIAQRLVEDGGRRVKYLYMGPNIESSNVSLPWSKLVLRFKLAHYRREAKRRGISDPSFVSTHHVEHRSTSRGPVLSGLRNLNRLVEAGYRSLLSGVYQRRGYLVLYDRHFVFDAARPNPHDQLVDRWYAWAVARLLPKPDLVLFLDAPAETLFARKGEGTVAYLERKREAIIATGATVPGFVRIDGDRPIDEVYDQVCECIDRLAAERPS